MFTVLILLGLAGYALGIAGFFMALAQSGRSDRLGARLSEMEDKQRDLQRENEFLAAAVRRERAAAPAAPVTSASSKPAAATTPLAESTIEPPQEQADGSAEYAPADATPEDGGEPDTTTWPAPPLPREVGFEERLGTRWAVWVGGVALALGALLLVRYSIEQGLLGPGMRVALGALLAVLLIAAGEWLRRNETKIEIEVIPSAHIPGVLTAAGTVAAFGTVYAAHALYGFIGPSAAFTLLGAVGVAAMLAAGLHGPTLAGLGLAGSFLAPMLVSTTTPSPWPLVLFLAIVAATAYALASLKRWNWLTVAAAVGGIAWGLVLTSEAADDRVWIAPAMLHALLQLGLAACYLAFNERSACGDETEELDVTATGILAAMATLVAAVLIAIQGVSPASVMFAAIAIAILVGAGLRHVPVAPSVAIAGALVIAKLLVWPSEAGSRLDFSTPESGAGWLFSAPLDSASFAAVALLAALAVAGLCGQRLLVSPRLKAWSAAYYAGTATLLPLLTLVVAYLRMTGYEPSFVFALAGIALAIAFGVAALTFEAREKDAATPAIRLGTGTFAASVVAAAALALVFYLERGYLTVALAIGAFATAYMADLKNIPILRKAVMALGLIVLARIVWDPRIMGDSVGTTAILNWLLFGYGVPAAAFFGAARVLEKREDDNASRLSDALAILFAGLLAFFEIRHFMNGGDVFAAHTDHVELGLMLLVALGFAYLLMRSGLTRRSKVFEAASLAFGGLAAAATVFGLLIGQNPLLNDDPVRSLGPINSLWLGYLAPAIAAALLARHSRGMWPKLLQLAAAGLALEHDHL